MTIYVGTYTKGSESEGIYRCTFDAETGALGEPILAGNAVNPSFLAKDPGLPILYAVAEDSSASVVSLRIGDDGNLERIDQVETGGSSACHVAISRKYGAVYAANYGDGSVLSCPVNTDGRFTGTPKTYRHSGSSADPKRQSGPHAHSVTIDPAGDYVLVADLGMDRIVTYRIHPESGHLTELGGASGTAISGSGPRHLTFGLDGDNVYCVNELTSTVTRYVYLPGKKLEAVQMIPGLPDAFEGVSYAADIHINPSPACIYSSNRGHDSIATFHIGSGGMLSPAVHTPSGGKNPRNFAVVAGGRYLIVANQDGDNLVVFAVGEDGIPQPTGMEVAVPRPVCVLPV